MTAGATETLARTPSPRVVAPRRRPLAIEQLGVLGGQIGAGIGNLAFSLVMVRLLDPGAFAALASFGALYLLLTMPAMSLTAGSALDPGLELRLGRLTLLVGSGVAVIASALAVPLGHLLHLSPFLVILLALAAPGAGPLALARGRLFAARRHAGLVASLLAEPVGRLVLGGALAPVLGATGGALAIVVAGYGSLVVARRAVSTAGPARTTRGVPGGHVVAAFLVLAVLQNQDIVLGNAVLGRNEAALFAIVSTLGGIAAFATVTVPMVLLARSTDHRRESLGVALAVAAGVGCLTVAAFAVAPVAFVTVLFGSQYRDAGGIAVPYLLAMALLGVGRVLAAHHSARGRGRATAMLLAAPALLQLCLVATVARSAAGVAEATLAATSLAVLVLGGAIALEHPAVRRAPARTLSVVRSPAALALFGISLVALGTRLLITRGLWVDEASSVAQAELTFHGMLHNLRTVDVHPPLYFSLLWLDLRAFGTGELAVRLPSIVAGMLLVPAVYAAGRELYDRRAGLVAAALAAFAPQTVWYSQEARMYSLFMLFAVLAVWGQVRVLRRGSTRDWALYVAAAVALVWTQYFAFFLVAVQQVVFAFAAWRDEAMRRRLLRGWLVCAAVFVALVAPLVPFAYHQFAVNQSSGRGFGSTPSQAGGVIAGETHPSLYAFLANGVWSVWGYHADATMIDLVALWPLAMLLALAMLGRGWSRMSSLLTCSALLPALALFVIGQRKSDLFDLRYFAGAVPILLLLAGRGLTIFTRNRVARIALASIFGASLLAGLVDQQLNSDNPRRYDFRGAIDAIESRARPGDVVLYNPVYLGQIVHYYAPGLTARPLAQRLPPRTGRGRVFLLGSFFDHRQIAAATGKALYDLGRTRRLVTRMPGHNVRVWEFR
jgi:4-amino-4-deoxy-L-arabinose transferase-like glycosyltransferase